MQNGPLGFKARPAEDENKEDAPNKEQEQPNQNEPQAEAKENKSEDEDEQHEAEEEGFDLDKLTENETKILNEKSRPIRQYLIDNVIPPIT